MSDTNKNEVKNEVMAAEVEANDNFKAETESSKKDFGKKALRVAGDGGLIALAFLGTIWIGEHVVHPLRKKWANRKKAKNGEQEEVANEEGTSEE